MQAAFCKGKRNSDSRSEERIRVNNCGFYKDITSDMEMVRQRGRSDYHLLFVAGGEMLVDGSRVTDGFCALYRPGERQEYLYKSGSGSIYYWVHFTGTQAEELVSGIKGRTASYRDKKSEVHALLEMMISAGLSADAGLDEYLSALFCALCTLLCTKRTESKPFLRAVAMMKDFSLELSVKDYAEACFMSVGHFERSFKAAYGCSPMKYRQRLQTDYAKLLLSGTNFKVAEIAALSGFSDPLYFSRVFKAETGVSPRSYRKNS